jgi:hypothetical protein
MASSFLTASSVHLIFKVRIRSNCKIPGRLIQVLKSNRTWYYS